MRLLTALFFIALMLRAPAEKLSAMARPPNWSNLDAYQRTITRAEFERLINTVYSPNRAFWDYAQIDDHEVVLFSKSAKPRMINGRPDPEWEAEPKRVPEFTLHFAASDATCLPLPFKYRTRGISNDPQRPLKGLKIALDPGHIGGEWAQLEGRYFKFDGDPPVLEAKLNLITAQILAERLEADGASIVWAKHGYDPTTDERPDTLHREAIAALSSNKSTTPNDELFGLRVPSRQRAPTQGFTERHIDNEAALLFYRVAEIRARADLVNAAHPDLTICIHYNADGWGNPDHPALTNSSRLIIFVNGTYETSELEDADIRYDLMRKLLDRDAAQEERGCDLVGRQMLDALGYPPDQLETSFSHQITGVPSVYARDLIANRLYHGPVIYCEGPYMNARDAYYRIIAGDYLGLRTIQGKSVPSIYRQYALAVERGVLEYFNAK
jgi:N-acetylmuramoyl-L-alanine amidase